jgi:predicted metal-dependent enzyme (double-stranded beta helix superfamily)
MLDRYLRDVRTVDWEDLEAVQAVSGAVLDALAQNRVLLHSLVAGVASASNLARLCERYDILDKLVLHDDESGFRIRLHVFQPGYFDRPHNHRWTYSSRILLGSYRHALFGRDMGLWEGIDVDLLRPLMVRTEEVGTTYTLSHNMVHSVVAQPHTVSLIVRGPAVKDRFLVADRATNKAWWQYGAAIESEQDAAAKRMSSDQIHGCQSLLTDLGLFAGVGVSTGS